MACPNKARTPPCLDTYCFPLCVRPLREAYQQSTRWNRRPLSEISSQPHRLVRRQNRPERRTSLIPAFSLLRLRRPLLLLSLESCDDSQKPSVEVPHQHHYPCIARDSLLTLQQVEVEGKPVVPHHA